MCARACVCVCVSMCVRMCVFVPVCTMYMRLCWCVYEIAWMDECVRVCVCLPACVFFSRMQDVYSRKCAYTLYWHNEPHSTQIGLSTGSVSCENVWSVFVKETDLCIKDPKKTTLSDLAVIAIPHKSAPGRKVGKPVLCRLFEKNVDCSSLSFNFYFHVRHLFPGGIHHHKSIWEGHSAFLLPPSPYKKFTSLIWYAFGMTWQGTEPVTSTLESDILSLNFRGGLVITDARIFINNHCSSHWPIYFILFFAISSLQIRTRQVACKIFYCSNYM